MVLGVEVNNGEDGAVVKLSDLEKEIMPKYTNPRYIESESKYLRMCLGDRWQYYLSLTLK